MLDTNIARPVARTGGTESKSFPHLCPFQPNGASKEFCVQQTQQFHRNTGGCCVTKCNSELRKCVVCLSLGLKGSELKYSADPSTGLCAIHADGKKAAPATAKPVGAPRPTPPPPSARGVPQAPAKSATPNKLGSDTLWGLANTQEWKRVFTRVNKALSEGVYVTIDPLKLRPMKGQPREYFPEEEQSSMEESLGLTGQIQDVIIRKKTPTDLSISPLILSGGRLWNVAETEYELVDGERRWRGILEEGFPIRAKLIEIDDEAAFFVSVCSNFNRVDHTLPERAKSLYRLMNNGTMSIPIEAAAALEGTSVETARKLLLILKLPQDVIDLMHPGKQKLKGQEVLGKMPVYEIARLASDPKLHEYARDFAKRSVTRQIKLSQLRSQIDAILSRSESGRNVVGERNQPARRFRLAESKMTVAADALSEVKLILTELKTAGTLPASVLKLETDFNGFADTSEDLLRLIGGTRFKKAAN